MEVWFNRAMALDTNNFDACMSKMQFLYPRWNGSREDMIAFGRECVASTKWGGGVPLTLAEALQPVIQLFADRRRKGGLLEAAGCLAGHKSRVRALL